MKVTRAVILAGGRGTRFLPYAKACPKEMLPIGDTPALQLLVREVVAADIKEVYVVISPSKCKIANYFKADKALNCFLYEAKKGEELNKVLNVCEGADIRFVLQKTPDGSGGAVAACRDVLAGSPFAYLNGDDLVFSQTSATKQLTDAFERLQKTVVGVQSVPQSETGKYGIVMTDSNFRMKELLEKPASPPQSRLALLGRNVFSANFFDYLDKIGADGNGEYLLTDAIRLQAKHEVVHAFEFEGRRFDLGNKQGFAQAVAWNMAVEERDENFLAFLRDLTASQ